MTRERRQSIRFETAMPVLVDHPTLGSIEMITADMCENGVFLKAAPQQCPPVGDEITLQVKSGFLGTADDAPRIRARVVRVTEYGMGVYFIDQ